jgi:hypothetical protein
MHKNLHIRLIILQHIRKESIIDFIHKKLHLYGYIMKRFVYLQNLNFYPERTVKDLIELTLLSNISTILESKYSAVASCNKIFFV